jgi:hypothetical protein
LGITIVFCPYEEFKGYEKMKQTNQIETPKQFNSKTPNLVEVKLLERKFPIGFSIDILLVSKYTRSANLPVSE